MKYIDFLDVTYVRGVTLERLWEDHEKSTDEYTWFWVYEPTEEMMLMQCDACVKRHSPLNFNCSANLKIKSPYTNFRRLYTFRENSSSNSNSIALGENVERVDFDGVIYAYLVKRMK